MCIARYYKSSNYAVGKVSGCAVLRLCLAFITFLQAPNEQTRSTLRSLFPSPSGRSFQPVQEPPLKKKKLSMERRKRLTICLLPAAHTTVPRGATRIQLNEQGRVQEILILHSWTELRVRQSIAEVFLRILDEDDPEEDIIFMSSNAGAGISTAPDPNTFDGQSSEVGWTGNKVQALAGRGCLYIKSKKEIREVCLPNIY